MAGKGRILASTRKNSLNSVIPGGIMLDNSPEAASQEKRATSWVLPVATAGVVIAAFCLYYFVYVRAQREYLGNRNFRALAALGDQLQTMVTIHGSILEFYADL